MKPAASATVGSRHFLTFAEGDLLIRRNPSTNQLQTALFLGWDNADGSLYSWDAVVDQTVKRISLQSWSWSSSPDKIE